MEENNWPCILCQHPSCWKAYDEIYVKKRKLQYHCAKHPKLIERDVYRDPTVAVHNVFEENEARITPEIHRVPTVKKSKLKLQKKTKKDATNKKKVLRIQTLQPPIDDSVPPTKIYVWLPGNKQCFATDMSKFPLDYNRISYEVYLNTLCRDVSPKTDSSSPSGSGISKVSQSSYHEKVLPELDGARNHARKSSLQRRNEEKVLTEQESNRGTCQMNSDLHQSRDEVILPKLLLEFTPRNQKIMSNGLKTCSDLVLRKKPRQFQPASFTCTVPNCPSFIWKAEHDADMNENSADEFGLSVSKLLFDRNTSI